MKKYLVIWTHAESECRKKIRGPRRLVEAWLAQANVRGHVYVLRWRPAKGYRVVDQFFLEPAFE